MYQAADPFKLSSLKPKESLALIANLSALPTSPAYIPNIMAERKYISYNQVFSISRVGRLT